MSAAAPTGTSTLVSFPRSRRNVAGDKWSKWRCETRETSTLGRCSGAIPGATRRRDNPPTVEVNTGSVRINLSPIWTRAVACPTQRTASFASGRTGSAIGFSTSSGVLKNVPTLRTAIAPNVQAPAVPIEATLSAITGSAEWSFIGCAMSAAGRGFHGQRSRSWSCRRGDVARRQARTHTRRVSRGEAFLLLMPLVTYGVLFLSPAGAGAVAAACSAVTLTAWVSRASSVAEIVRDVAPFARTDRDHPLSRGAGSAHERAPPCACLPTRHRARVRRRRRDPAAGGRRRRRSRPGGSGLRASRSEEHTSEL